jgi:hypothetical protein
MKPIDQRRINPTLRALHGMEMKFTQHLVRMLPIDKEIMLTASAAEYAEVRELRLYCCRLADWAHNISTLTLLYSKMCEQDRITTKSIVSSEAELCVNLIKSALNYLKRQRVGSIDGRLVGIIADLRRDAEYFLHLAASNSLLT